MTNYIISKSPAKTGSIGIMGHAGAGHVHSHSGFIQDDSAGFAVAVTLLREAFPADTIIQRVDIVSDSFIVTTVGGGIGKAYARRGITPYEAELAQRVVGHDGVCSQALAFRAFGRIYGQGVTEAPVALQTAICHAVMNTFVRKYPEEVFYGDEDLEGTVGGCLGAVVSINEVPVSILATLNAAAGGLGPIEDAEGNLAFGGKKKVMEQLGLDKLPTIILESKAYVPSACKELCSDVMWIRYNEEADNPEVGKALALGARDADVVTMLSNAAYERGVPEIRQLTGKLGARIEALGAAFARAETSLEKVTLISELAEIVSQDAGGVTFMTAQLHEKAGGGGLQPGMTAVLSMAVAPQNIKKSHIPICTLSDVRCYISVTLAAIPHLVKNIDKAHAVIAERAVELSASELAVR